jgi:hypothetical protein
MRCEHHTWTEYLVAEVELEDLAAFLTAKSKEGWQNLEESPKSDDDALNASYLVEGSRETCSCKQPKGRSKR